MSARIHSCPECGAILTKIRSPQDHRRFFALINRAFEHWPDHEFRPSTSEHLRAWLLVSVGYYDAQPIPLNEEMAQNPHLLALARLTVEAAVAAAFRDRDYAFPEFTDNGCEIRRPKSINWETLDQKSFGKIREAVEDAIEAAMGVTADQLLREKAA
jgi:hypothetical protein